MQINLMTPINQLGYGVAGLNIFKELRKQADVSLFPIGEPQVVNEEDANAVRSGMSIAKFYNSNAPCIKIWHQNQMAERIGSGKFIGFPIFELDTFSDLEKHHLQSCDELMVCSQWARKVVIGNNFGYYKADGRPKLPPKTHVVPLGVDLELFPPAPVANDKTIFFNCGKWEKRKGHDVLIECFNRAFREDDNVELWMMCDNPFIGDSNEKWRSLYKTSPLGSKIKIIPRQHSQQDVYNIMSRTDCGVFPARAEGWNLEALEMLACGKNIITTDYSAHQEFCNKDNSFLIDINEKEMAHDGVFFDGMVGKWASLGDKQKEQLVEHMRMVHNTKQQYVNGWDTQMREFSSLNHEGIKTAQQFTWKNTANKIMEILNG